MSTDDHGSRGDPAKRVGMAWPLIVFLVFAILGPLIGGVIAVAALLMAMSLGPDAPSLKGGAGI
jgi:hypothetical protein